MADLHCYDWDDRELQYYLNMCSSILSIAGCLFIISVYLRFEHIRIFAFKLVCTLAVFDLLHSVSFLIPTFELENGARCQIQAVMISFCSLCSILWTGVIALTLYLAVYWNYYDVDQKFNLYLISTIVLGLLGAFLPFTTDSYGPGDGWCWIKETGKTTEIVWSLCTFYVPLWLIFALNVYSNLCVIIVINREIASEDDTLRRDLVRRLIIYPAILVVCFLPVTVKRIYEFVHDCSPVELFYISGFFASLVGTCNSIAYGFNSTVRQALGSCCATSQESLIDEPSTEERINKS